jgi:hypothetical protein
VAQAADRIAQLTGVRLKETRVRNFMHALGMTNYSGVATYEKKINLPAEAAHAPMVLRLGAASGSLPDTGRGAQGYVAPINSPVRDAAVVFVNGQRAGAAWCPPFAVEVTGLLKEGENTLRIEVGNTAVNYLAKAGFPNYNLAGLRQAYGNRLTRRT